MLANIKRHILLSQAIAVGAGIGHAVVMPRVQNHSQLSGHVRRGNRGGFGGWRGVGTGVGSGVGTGVGCWVGSGVGTGVGSGVGMGVGAGVSSGSAGLSVTTGFAVALPTITASWTLSSASPVTSMAL